VYDAGGGGATPHAGEPTAAAAPAPAPARARDDEEDDAAEEDPRDLIAGTAEETDHASEAEARLRETFPGTSEVAE
jgi:hypothetical protein